MNILVDLHTHTVASGHAYSTIREIAQEAKNKGMDGIGISDHGPTIPGSAQFPYFSNLRVIPEEIYGIRIYKGVEANIIDFNGNVDMPLNILKKLDYAIASFHEVCVKPKDIGSHTNAVLKVMENPYIDIIGHPGNPLYQIDIEKVVLGAKRYNKLIEINNHSFVVRSGSEENCGEFVRLCKKYEVKIACGSDAHICFDVGKFNNVINLLREEDMPEELIINLEKERWESYLLKRKGTV